MSEENQENTPPNELDLLKSRARMMGITFSNNIGPEALKAKIEEKMSGKSEEPNENKVQESQTNPLQMSEENQDGIVVPSPVKIPTLREKLYNEQMALVRCRITNLDPKKKDLPGEIVTFANEYLGTVRKFVPFGEHTEDGYHLETCIFNLLKERRFLNIRSVRDRRTGTEQVTQTWAPEFALEVLPPLTEEELKQLAQAQTAAGSIESSQAA